MLIWFGFKEQHKSYGKQNISFFRWTLGFQKIAKLHLTFQLSYSDAKPNVVNTSSLFRALQALL